MSKAKDRDEAKARFFQDTKEYGPQGHKQQILQEVREDVFSLINEDDSGLEAMRDGD